VTAANPWHFLACDGIISAFASIVTWHFSVPSHYLPSGHDYLSAKLVPDKDSSLIDPSLIRPHINFMISVQTLFSNKFTLKYLKP
jgi:hypothetical protein